MKIDSYSFGSIVIDGKKYTEDLVLFPDRVRSNWWREEGHLLQIQDLEEILEESPDLLIVGTGAYGRMSITEEVKKKLEERDIELKAKKTEEATELWNKLSKKREVMAALHLTC